MYLGDVRFDAFGQLDTWFSKELGQLVWDVLVFIQSIQETQTLELFCDALAAHLEDRVKRQTSLVLSLG